MGKMKMDMGNIRRKLRSKRGETLAETLASVVIVAMMMTMIAGAVVAAARVNSRADNKENTLHVSDAVEMSGAAVSFTVTSTAGKTGNADSDYKGTTGAATTDQVQVKLYHDEKSDYYFFE